MRDTLYAAADRATNVSENGDNFSIELKEVEVNQIRILMNQCRGASEKTISEGVLSTTNWDIIREKLNQAESALALLDFETVSTRLNDAGDVLAL